MGAGGGELCGECTSPVEPGQRYCLECGARVGSRSRALESLLRRAGGPAGVAVESVEAAVAHPPAPRASMLRLPAPRFSALLVLAFLGFGVLMGAVASSPVQGTLAASTRPRLNVVLPPAAAPSAPPSGESIPTTPSTPAAEPPSSEAEPTPPPASAPSAPAPAAKAPSPNPPHSPGEGGSGAASPGAPATKLPPIKHVFMIVLSGQPYASAFGPSSTAHYLTSTLERKGALLVHYDAVAHEALANEIALLSGQGPTPETAANCPTYASIAPASGAPEEQVIGAGCVYPATTQTLPGQLTAKRLTWRAYLQGIDEPGVQAPACAHPALGAPDPTAAAGAGTGPYATFRNPFVYFQSIVASPSCATGDVGLAKLRADLAASPRRTPSLSYIVPDRCHDGNPTPCAAGSPAGLLAADEFLKSVVPEILASRAYRQNGLLAITVDQAPATGEYGDSSACCGQPRFPNLPPSASGLSPRGGGAVGALLLSPYVKGPTTNQEPYNHFSLLRTIEDLFGLKHLGYAALPAVKPLEPALFTAGKAG